MFGRVQVCFGSNAACFPDPHDDNATHVSFPDKTEEGASSASEFILGICLRHPQCQPDQALQDLLPLVSTQITLMTTMPL